MTRDETFVLAIECGRSILEVDHTGGKSLRYVMKFRRIGTPTWMSVVASVLTNKLILPPSLLRLSIHSCAMRGHPPIDVRQAPAIDDGPSRSAITR